MASNAPLLSDADEDESPEVVPFFEEALVTPWLQDLHACRRVFSHAKRFAIHNAVLEKVAGGLNYLGLTWATVVILSGHASGLDMYDFLVVTVLLLASALRILLVSTSSDIIKLWQSGATNSRWGHILPLHGNYHGVRRTLSTVKVAVMLLASAAAVWRIGAMAAGGPNYSGRPYTQLPIQGALLIFYVTVVLETLASLLALAHRWRYKEWRVKRIVRMAARGGGGPHVQMQAFLWRRFARYVLDECMTGTLRGGLQMEPVAFLVYEAVFTRRLVLAPAPLGGVGGGPSRQGSVLSPRVTSPLGARVASMRRIASKLMVMPEMDNEADFFSQGLVGALDPSAPLDPPPEDDSRLAWRLKGFHAQALAAKLVSLFVVEGTVLEKGVIRWLLEKDPEVSYWHEVLSQEAASTRGNSV